jgi:DNA-binding CsgD family transcriptional regulator
MVMDLPKSNAHRRATGDYPYGLSAREWDVYCLILTGIRNKDIGEKLFISEKTVKFHCTSIYRKLKVRGKVEILASSVDSPFGKRQ